MNKFVIVAVALIIVTVSVQVSGVSRYDELLKYIEECKAETGSTDGDLNVITGYKSTEKAWCLIGCIEKKTGVLGPDNRVHYDIIQKKLALLMEKFPEVYEKAGTAVQQCRPQIESLDSTPCTAAKALGECLMTKMYGTSLESLFNTKIQ